MRNEEERGEAKENTGWQKDTHKSKGEQGWGGEVRGEGKMKRTEFSAPRPLLVFTLKLSAEPSGGRTDYKFEQPSNHLTTLMMYAVCKSLFAAH